MTDELLASLSSNERLAPVRRRAAALSAWLNECGNGCLDEQAHLDAGSVEQIYWHYGYLVALRDVLRRLSQ